MSTIDWNNGVYQAPGTENLESTFRITIGADWGALWDYADLMQRDPLAVYGDLLPLFREGALNIFNVECALGERGAPFKKGGPNLRGADGTVRALSEVPVHVGTLANNHIMDFGPESLQETIDILHDAGVQTVGAGANGAEAAKPIITQMKDATLGIINCAEGEACASINGGPGTHPFDVLALTEQIQELKKQVDAVLVIFHGGREYIPSPPPYVINGLRKFADAGATAVIAHHPHVPQGVEIHNGVPIAYSQGNFVFRWADTREDYRYFVSTGYLVHLDFAGKVLSQLSLTPYRMKADGVFALQGDDKTQLLNELEQVSELLKDDTKTQQAWNAVVDTQGEKYLRNMLQNLLNQFDEDGEAAAARLHNVFFCPAHREQMLNGLKRISHGELGDSPQWAKELVTDWTTRKLT